MTTSKGDGKHEQRFKAQTFQPQILGSCRGFCHADTADSLAARVTALIMSGGAVIAYILGEGMVDAEHTVGDDENKVK